MSKPFYFSLTFKLLFFVVCYLVGISAMWYMSADDLRTAEKKFSFMEHAYQLDNLILEIRRYEKNYFLYGTQEALRVHQEYLEEAKATVEIVDEQLSHLKGHPQLMELQALMDNYQDNFHRLEDNRSFDPATLENLVEKTRELGKQMTEKSSQLLEYERTQLQSILHEFKVRMSLWSAIAINLGILMPFLTFFKIFQPLKIIKKATGAIAKGRFKKIEVLNTRDEMQQVMEAFNTMVHELELRQDQLVQSQKLSSIGTLTAGVAHQLNNPLNNISTSCQIAMSDLEEKDTSMLEKMLKNIDQETLRARDVVKGLLEFSRSEKFKLRPTYLAKTVKRVVQLAKSEVPADISVEITIPEELEVPMDPQRMQEVFLNLIINAAQAIEHEGFIHITSEIDTKEGVVAISVQDSGPGIPEELQNQLFDPFFTTKEEGKGTGLGLSVVYGIIQKHRGEITVSSKLGQGTSFVIRLPLNHTASIS